VLARIAETGQQVVARERGELPDDVARRLARQLLGPHLLHQVAQARLGQGHQRRQAGGARPCGGPEVGQELLRGRHAGQVEGRDGGLEGAPRRKLLAELADRPAQHALELLGSRADRYPALLLFVVPLFVVREAAQLGGAVRLDGKDHRRVVRAHGDQGRGVPGGVELLHQAGQRRQFDPGAAEAVADRTVEDDQLGPQPWLARRDPRQRRRIERRPDPPDRPHRDHRQPLARGPLDRRRRR